MRSQDDEHWTDHAICRGADPELFHPIGYTGAVLERQVKEAKVICAHCPVTADCLSWALRAGEPDGIWGGTTPEERRMIRYRKRTTRVAPARQPAPQRPAIAATHQKADPTAA